MKNIITNTSKLAYKGMVFWLFSWLTVFWVAYAASITSTTDTVSSGDSITANWYQDVNNKLGGINVSSGNVGIGTSSPSVKLDVQSSTSGTVARITGPNAYNAESGLEFSVGRAKISWVLNGSGGTPWTSLRFHTMSNGGSVTERMRIDWLGNVGIGTSSPDRELHINWGIWWLSGVRLTRSDIAGSDVDLLTWGWADWKEFLINVTGTERMRIDSVGSVLIWKTTRNSYWTKWLELHAGWRFDATRDSLWYAYATHYAWNWSNIWWVYINSSTTTSFLTSSDYRLKENVTPISSAVERLNALKPVRFNFKADTETTVDGFLAHEVQEVVPEAVSWEKDWVDEEWKPEYQAMDYAKVTPLLTAALQETIKENKEMRKELELLKKEIEILKNK
mgnify:CR=1 FL=1